MGLASKHTVKVQNPDQTFVKQKNVVRGVHTLMAIVCVSRCALSFFLPLCPPTFLCLFFTLSLFDHLFVCRSGHRICQILCHNYYRLWNLQTYADLVDYSVLKSPVCSCMYLFLQKSQFLALSLVFPLFSTSSPSQPCHTRHDLFSSKTLLNYSMRSGWIQITVLIFKSLFLAKGLPSFTVSISLSWLWLLFFTPLSFPHAIPHYFPASSLICLDVKHCGEQKQAIPL